MIARPPYAPLEPTRQFFERASRLGRVPERVDRGFLVSLELAPSNEASLVAALKYLGIVTSDGRPTAAFGALALSPEARQEELRRVVRSAYGALWERFPDLRRASRSEIHDFFVGQYGVRGQLARKAVSFFSLMAELAGVELDESLATRGSGRREEARRPAIRQRETAALGAAVANRARSTVVPPGRLALPDFGTATVVLQVNVTAEQSEDEIVELLRRVRRAVERVELDRASQRPAAIESAGDRS
ncbi:MAG: DUF5343 domain-containing protein [Chloroflexi bacterium]|nr:DUF5343 domain-containing protein [Chloroflexota bacterium]